MTVTITLTEQDGKVKVRMTYDKGVSNRTKRLGLAAMTAIREKRRNRCRLRGRRVKMSQICTRCGQYSTWNESGICNHCEHSDSADVIAKLRAELATLRSSHWPCPQCGYPYTTHEDGCLKCRLSGADEAIDQMRARMVELQTNDLQSAFDYAKELPGQIAEILYDWMRDLKHNDGWVVHCSEFLPANVTCDFYGKAKFIQGITDQIRAAVEYAKNKQNK